MIYKELLVGVIALLNICIIQAQNPTERCEMQGGRGKVCNDCLSTFDCATLSQDPACASGMICDITIVDGFCISSDSNESPICMCATTEKCLVDPNSDSVLLDCSAGTSPAAIFTPPDCTADLTKPIFDPDPAVCDCVEIDDCPACGSIATDLDSECITDFIFCGSGTSSLVSCGPDECYNATSCLCFLNPECGDCGYKGVENDPTKYIYCENGEVEEMPCPFETTYDPELCVCVSEETSSCPPPTDCSATCPPPTDCSTTCPQTTESSSTCPPPIECPTSCPSFTEPTSVCLACGLEAGSASCSEYYSCNEDGRTGGPYDCPGNLCFDAATCNCIEVI